MDDLIAFVRARLDEDEAAAKAAASDDSRARSWSDGEGGYPVAGPLVEDGWHVVVVPPGATWGQVRHIARHDPARVLREVEAGRKLIAAYEDAGKLSEYESAGEISGPWIGLCLAVRIRAAVWDDHPDYPQEWKP